MHYIQLYILLLQNITVLERCGDAEETRVGDPRKAMQHQHHLHLQNDNFKKIPQEYRPTQLKNNYEKHRGKDIPDIQYTRCL